MSTVLFAGGGSGGHLFPGVAVAAELARQDPRSRSIFVCSDRAMERQILDHYPVEQFPLPARPASAFLRSPWSSAVSNWQAHQSAVSLIKQTSPSVVVGLGGFASVPTVLAARRCRIPIVLLEQNLILGRANRLLLPFADSICLSYPETPLPKRHIRKAVVTGNPLRREIIESAKNSSSKTESELTLLVLGGSQGATAINEATLNAAARLQNQTHRWRIVHQTGIQQIDWVKKEYERLGITATCEAFFEEMAFLYQQADLVVSRAGGTTLAELAVRGLPAVLIPYPRSVREHQKLNAEYFVREGGAKLVEQSGQPIQTADRLAVCLRTLLTEFEQRASMHDAMLNLARPDAAVSVAQMIRRYAAASQLSGCGR